MKKSKSKSKLLIALALLSVGQISKANEVQGSRFIPLEQLHPNDRMDYAARIRKIETIVKIDWGTVVAGVDETGALVFKNREILDNNVVASPSSWVGPGL